MKFDLKGEFLGYQRLGMRDCTVVRVPPHANGLYTAMYARINGKDRQVVGSLGGNTIAIEGQHEPKDVAALEVTPLQTTEVGEVQK